MLTKHTCKHARTFGVLVFSGTLVLFESGCYSGAPGPKTESSQTQPATVSPLENKMIRRPCNAPEDAKVYVVQGGKKHWIVDARGFATHAFRFPGDVLVPVSEFDCDPIPVGVKWRL
jgi:hypothetical protein